jgi:hypothetical protein
MTSYNSLLLGIILNALVLSLSMMTCKSYLDLSASLLVVNARFLIYYYQYKNMLIYI